MDVPRITHHRVITISGICPGAGKSTLAAALAADLTQLGILNRLLTEDHLLETEWFGRFDRQLGETDPRAIETLLEGARALTMEYSATGLTVITDALLPGFMWLLGRYPRDRVEQYAAELREALRPLQPLHVYLGGDPISLFARAVAARETSFPERMLAAVKRWHVPHYPDGPPQSDADVMRFFLWIDGQVREMDATSQATTLFLDATRRVDDLLQLLWERLELGA